MCRLPGRAAGRGEQEQADVLHPQPSQVLQGRHQQAGDVHQVEFFTLQCRHFTIFLRVDASQRDATAGPIFLDDFIAIYP